MSYCSKCGDVVASKFCANCGTDTGGNPIGSGSISHAEGGNVLRPNLPANRMAMSYKRNFPQRNFLLWFFISIIAVPLTIIVFFILGLFPLPISILVSGIVYGVYTYFLMIDFTKYVGDMKRKDKVISTIELPFESSWLFPLLIMIPYGLHAGFLFTGVIFNFETLTIIPFIFISFFYCVPGMIFLYLKHKIMSDVSRQALEQQILPTPVNVKDPLRPLIVIGTLYACLFLVLIVLIFVLKNDSQILTDYLDSDTTSEDGVPDTVVNAIARLVLFGVVVLILLIAMLLVWTYYEYQWHSFLYQLIKASHFQGILGDDNISDGVVGGSPPLS